MQKSVSLQFKGSVVDSLPIIDKTHSTEESFGFLISYLAHPATFNNSILGSRKDVSLVHMNHLVFWATVRPENGALLARLQAIVSVPFRKAVLKLELESVTSVCDELALGTYFLDGDGPCAIVGWRV